MMIQITLQIVSEVVFEWMLNTRVSEMMSLKSRNTKWLEINFSSSWIVSSISQIKFDII